MDNNRSGFDFTKQTPDDAPVLIKWLTAETWHFFGHPDITEEDVEDMIKSGRFISDETESFWITDKNGGKIGHIRLFDLIDNAPMFDIRISSIHRGKGVGTAAVKWLTSYLFENHSKFNRIEAQTRNDNTAMRKVLKKCGYVKEAHYRNAWPAPDGTLFDSVGYGIIKSDWEKGITTPVKWDDENF